VRVADGEPGDELQVDFGRLGFLVDPDSGRRDVSTAPTPTARPVSTFTESTGATFR
jgi:hypothetical protein